MSEEGLQTDVLIVGAGPAGLATAIRLKQLALAKNQPLSVIVLEKAATIGAHELSGLLLDPKALNELLPDWQIKIPSFMTPVKEDLFYLLTAKRRLQLPCPPLLNNQGNYICSLGSLCEWLAKEAQDLGVEIFPEFAATALCYDSSGEKVIGLMTGDKGLDKEREALSNYQPGFKIEAKHIFLAEGCRGSLSEEIKNKFNLNQHNQPQTYGLGFKEIWEVPSDRHKPGLVIHTLGWPLDQKTYGGGFLYHWGDNRISVGFVVGLDYENPYLDPFATFQQFKHHPLFADLFKHGKRLSYGARALSEGGYQSIPQLTIPGLTLIGDAAGFLNVGKLKGTHTAMKSGMIAAETYFSTLNRDPHASLLPYREALNESWLIKEELYPARNIRPGFKKGLWLGLVNAALETYLFKGRSPWTLKHRSDHQSLKPASLCTPPLYPKPDNQISFDKSSSIYLSHINQRENQPCHLQIRNPEQMITLNWAVYASPEARYCPAGVYEIEDKDNETPKFMINSSNCIHCKTCDIKDPGQNIHWVPPEGGSGPNYQGM